MKEMKQIVTASILSALVFCFSTGTGAEELEVTVSATKGYTTVIKDGRETPLSKGRTLNSGDTVKTTTNGEVTLTWLGNVVKVYPLSRFSIEKAALEDKTTKSSMKLDTGKIFARAAKLQTPESSFAVRTPTAVAGVRGSEIFITSAPDKSSFVVLSGEFEVAADGMSIILDQSTKVALGPGATEAESSPQSVSSSEMSELQAQADAVMQEAGIESESSQAPADEPDDETTDEPAGEQADVTEATETAIDETTTNDTITSPVTDTAIQLEEGTGGVNLTID